MESRINLGMSQRWIGPDILTQRLKCLRYDFVIFFTKSQPARGYADLLRRVFPREKLTYGSGYVAEYIPILVWLICCLGFAAVSLILPHLVAPSKRTPVKGMPYESGVDPVEDARKPMDIKFYLIAILFLVFDLELIFIYPWAVAFRSEGGLAPEMRPLVMVVLLTLIWTLAIAFLIAWRKGVFEWRQN